MRAILAFCALCATAAPAAAQPLNPGGTGLQATMDLQLRLNALQAQQDMIERQSVIQQNQLSNLETQMRSQQALADVRAQAATPVVPQLSSGAQLDTGRLAQIPDAALADSDARVRAAAQNRR
jgi:hypothetical protein